MELILAANLVSVEPGLIFWKTITFLLLLLVLYKFAWGPIVRALQEREETIDTSLRRAERALAEARQIQAENERTGARRSKKHSAFCVKRARKPNGCARKNCKRRGCKFNKCKLRRKQRSNAKSKAHWTSSGLW